MPEHSISQKKGWRDVREKAADEGVGDEVELCASPLPPPSIPAEETRRIESTRRSCFRLSTKKDRLRSGGNRITHRAGTSSAQLRVISVVGQPCTFILKIHFSLHVQLLGLSFPDQ